MELILRIQEDLKTESGRRQIHRNGNLIVLVEYMNSIDIAKNLSDGTIVVRCLRNACAGVAENAMILQREGVIARVFHLCKSLYWQRKLEERPEEHEGLEDSIRPGFIYALCQLLANFSNCGAEHCDYLWSADVGAQHWADLVAISFSTSNRRCLETAIAAIYNSVLKSQKNRNANLELLCTARALLCQILLCAISTGPSLNSTPLSSAQPPTASSMDWLQLLFQLFCRQGKLLSIYLLVGPTAVKTTSTGPRKNHTISHEQVIMLNFVLNILDDPSAVKACIYCATGGTSIDASSAATDLYCGRTNPSPELALGELFFRIASDICTIASQGDRIDIATGTDTDTDTGPDADIIITNSGSASGGTLEYVGVGTPSSAIGLTGTHEDMSAGVPSSAIGLAGKVATSWIQQDSCAAVVEEEQERLAVDSLPLLLQVLASGLGAIAEGAGGCATNSNRPAASIDANVDEARAVEAEAEAQSDGGGVCTGGCETTLAGPTTTFAAGVETADSATNKDSLLDEKDDFLVGKGDLRNRLISSTGILHTCLQLLARLKAQQQVYDMARQQQRRQSKLQPYPRSPGSVHPNTCAAAAAAAGTDRLTPTVGGGEGVGVGVGGKEVRDSGGTASPFSLSTTTNVIEDEERDLRNNTIKSLLQLMGNLFFRCPAAQNQLRDLDGIPVILSCCATDFSNPLSREWALLCIRNALEGNVLNQQFVDSLQLQGSKVVSENLKESGIDIEIRPETGTFRFHQQKSGSRFNSVNM